MSDLVKRKTPGSAWSRNGRFHEGRGDKVNGQRPVGQARQKAQV